VRFDDRATGKLSEFCPRARTVHVDIDARELGKLRALELGICCDARCFLEQLVPRVPARRRRRWLARVTELARNHPLVLPAGEQPQRAPHLVRRLATRLAQDTVVTTDVGQHQMWVAQLLPFHRPRQLLTSGGLGSMGFGLPAAIGAALAGAPRVVCVTGDGSLAINVQELATLADLDLDVTVLLLDNQHLGLVRQQQALFYGERFSAAAFDRGVDFVALARAMGLQACSLGAGAEGFAQLDALLAQRGPRLIHAAVDATDHVLPMVPPGAANHEMLRA
jgi:acetolactate synthase-1/2/3 large subunit